MAEEKRTTEKLILTMSSTLKEWVEKEAEKIAITTTQYVMNLIVTDRKKKD
jgi:hypothetical protein